MILDIVRNNIMKTKKIIISIAVLIFISIISFGLYLHFSQNQKYDYKFYDEIPKGYIEYNGYLNSGKDYDHLFWYKYSKQPELCKNYKLIGDDFDLVKKCCNIMTFSNGSGYDVDETVPFISL